MYKSKIKIGKKSIGYDHPVYIIAEIGINHEGDPDLCMRMIDEAASAGADAIKLQTMDPEQNYASDSASYKLFKKAWLTPEQTKKMFDFSRSLKIEPITTVGDFKTLQWVRKLKPNAYKISSGLISHVPLIKEISLLKKPVVISTGTADLKEIEHAVKVVKNNKNDKIILLHCVSVYPTPPAQANLLFIEKLREIYGPFVGYSDHTLGDLAVTASVALGSCMIEKHFTLDKSRKSFDHNISLNPDEFRTMIKKVRSTEKMVNKNFFSISPIEKENKKWMRRIIVAKNDININGEITMNDILYLRKSSKETSISASETEKIIGKRVKKTVKKLQPICWTNLE